MTRLIFALMLVIYASISTSIAFAQEALENQGGTVRGQITDTTETQNPIEGVTVVVIFAQDGTEFTTMTDANGDYKRTGLPAGRYLINIHKEGYGDRFGKPVTIFNGEDHYVPLKMTEKDNIVTFFHKRFGFLFWILFLCGITALLTFLFTKRWMTEKFEGSRRQ